ncbi:MarR family winged helix-turn-helix transcriptional regulator [Acuticoccus sp.]|uniref:MarR family winged helix-turn-helix transcriptional regulator n=1 Tax=Acuticoccus sp. TaxID=1904378 RepID=UPI003B51BC1D
MIDLILAEDGDAGVAYELIELMFFGYRDFVGIADEQLASRGYGRAHHRVLHFVDRHPGLTVGELLAILKVTKQGVARTLRTLVDDGLIEVRAGATDRREKRLATTPAGHDLAREIARLQSRHIEGAVRAAGRTGGAGAQATVATFLAALVREDERDTVRHRIAAGR